MYKKCLFVKQYWYHRLRVCFLPFFYLPWKFRIQEVERNRILKTLQNMTTRLVREVTSKYKAQENSNAQQTCKCVQFNCTSIILIPLNEIFSKKGLRKAKAVSLKQLQHHRQIGKHLKTVKRYYFKLPLSAGHEAHPVGALEL